MVRKWIFLILILVDMWAIHTHDDTMAGFYCKLVSPVFNVVQKLSTFREKGLVAAILSCDQNVMASFGIPSDIFFNSSSEDTSRADDLTIRSLALLLAAVAVDDTIISPSGESFCLFKKQPPVLFELWTLQSPCIARFSTWHEGRRATAA